MVKIVLTGAPASGKTGIFERLRTLPEFADMAFLEELARKLLLANPEYRRNWREFHLDIYRRQLTREDALADRSFITDRGTADAFAFHPETMADVGTSLEGEYARYTHVLHLGSSARLGEEHYHRDAVRNESVAEALAIEDAITRVWQGHPKYRLVPAAVDYDVKFEQVLSLIRTYRDRG